MNAQRFNPWRQFYGAFVPEWLMRSKAVSPGAKLCYARLCRYAGKEGVAYPTLVDLAEELAVSKRSVQNYITELVDANLIEVEQVGLNQPNRYHFLRHPMIDGEADVATPEVQDAATPEWTDVATPSSSRESARRVTLPDAPRRVGKRKAKPDSDEGLASNRLPAEPVVDDTPRRGPTIGGLAKAFEREARTRYPLGDPRRITNMTALRANISRWKGDGISLEQIEQAMEAFFASNMVKEGQEPWKRFITTITITLKKASAPDISNPDYYTDTQEDEMDAGEKWLKENGLL